MSEPFAICPRRLPLERTTARRLMLDVGQIHHDDWVGLTEPTEVDVCDMLCGPRMCGITESQHSLQPARRAK